MKNEVEDESSQNEAARIHNQEIVKKWSHIDDIKSMSSEELLVRFRTASRGYNQAWTISFSLILDIFALELTFSSVFSKSDFSRILTNILNIIVYASTMFIIVRRSFRMEEISRKFLHQNDICYSAPLVEMATSGSSGFSKEIRIALTNLLPQFKASDSPLLSFSNRKKLRALLTYSQGYKTAEYIDFQLAILKCLEQVGNGDDLKVIENIATSSRSYDSRLETAAKACIPYLQNKIIELNESQCS